MPRSPFFQCLPISAVLCTVPMSRPAAGPSFARFAGAIRVRFPEEARQDLRQLLEGVFADHPPLPEQDRAGRGPGNSQPGVFRLLGSVDLAPHDRHARPVGQVLQHRLDERHEAHDVRAPAAAGRARHQVHPPRAQMERLQDLVPHPHLTLRPVGQRHAQRVPDALRQQRGNAGRALDDPAVAGTGLRQADVQGEIGIRPGNQEVGPHRLGDGGGLRREDDILEPVLQQQLRLLSDGQKERRGAVPPRLLELPPREGPPVGPDADDDARILRGPYHFVQAPQRHVKIKNPKVGKYNI